MENFEVIWGFCDRVTAIGRKGPLSPWQLSFTDCTKPAPIFARLIKMEFAVPWPLLCAKGLWSAYAGVIRAVVTQVRRRGVFGHLPRGFLDECCGTTAASYFGLFPIWGGVGS
jgi:hypothetical protein